MSLTKKERKTRLSAQEFGLYLGLAGVTMMFVAFTSAYLVRRAEGNWLEFRLPDAFFISTIMIVLSSIALEMSFRGFSSNKEKTYKSFLMLALALGIGFCFMQYRGWMDMNSIGVTLDGNPSGSFVYVITALHVAHVLIGITALIVALMHALTLPYFVSDQRLSRFKNTLRYWHFVDFLWIYLLLFFTFFK